MPPVPRLPLPPGQVIDAPAAYVRALDLSVSRLDQTYQRLDDWHYDYTSRPGFRAVLEYDAAGLVLDYRVSQSASPEPCSPQIGWEPSASPLGAAARPSVRGFPPLQLPRSLTFRPAAVATSERSAGVSGAGRQEGHRPTIRPRQSGIRRYRLRRAPKRRARALPSGPQATTHQGVRRTLGSLRARPCSHGPEPR